MNSPPIKQAVSTRTPEETTYLDWLQRTAHPVLAALRALTNELSQNKTQTVTSSTTLELQADVILVDATTGPVTVTPPAAALWERRIIVIKTDASANAVTVVAVNTATLSAQYDACELICDGTLYYALVFGASSAVTEPEIRVSLASDQNDYSPTGWSDARWVFLNVTVGCNVTGFDANVTQRRKTLIHVGTEEIPVLFLEESPSSAAANRIRIPTPNDVGLLKNRTLDIWYDTTDLRWRLV